MTDSVSEQSLYIDSEDEDVENVSDKAFNEGNYSDSSDTSIGSQQQQNIPTSYVTSWPKSYRQSIDTYSSVLSPNIGFLGTPTLSRLSSSFHSSSLTRRHTPEILSPLIKSFISKEEDEQQKEQNQRRSSHALIPPIKKPTLKKTGPDPKPSKVSHELLHSRQCSYGQSTLNGMNVLCGVGILSTPYAVKEGGWFGLSILFFFAGLSWYTGVLLRYCLDSEPGLQTYPDIGQAAFGTIGRFAISIILYVELYRCPNPWGQLVGIGQLASYSNITHHQSPVHAIPYKPHVPEGCCVEYIILESDNLSSLFPNAHLSLGGFVLNSHLLFALMATLAVLPTLWLRDMSALSYISAGGVIASIVVVICLFWVGLVDKVGLHSKETTLNLSNLPVAIGLYGYCFSGHAVFPNIYTSMAKPSQYPSVLLTSFAVITVMYAGAAVMGYALFGETTLSQYTLNMPQNLVASKIAVWTTVVNPFTKYALTMSPVALSLEELIPSNRKKSHMYAILIRTALVISTLIVALTIPFFGLMMALIGSLFTMLVALIFPCACFLIILKGKVTWLQRTLCTSIIVVGTISSAFGTVSAISKIIENLS